MKKILIQDHVFLEDFCNLNCDYCKTATYNGEILDGNLVSAKRKLSIGELFEKTRYVLSKSRDLFDIYELKLSGGEILIIKNFIFELLEKEYENYEVVKILTNGTFLDDTLIRKLSEIDNLVLQISLDGHTIGLNKYRIKDPLSQKRLNNILVKVTEAGISIEINTVLTDANTGNFEEFLSFLSKNNIDAKILPFPVRYFDDYFPSKGDVSKFEDKVLGKYSDFEQYLPSRTYIRYLVDFLKNKNRKGKCYVPDFVLSTFEGGEASFCPCNFIKNYNGNLFSSFEELKNSINRKFSKSKGYLFSECKTCFTHYDLINLYVRGEISKKDLKKLPSINKNAFEYLP